MDGDQLIKSIDQIYFCDEGDFNLDHITNQLPGPDNLTSEYLLNHKARLESLLTVVTRKVSELILSHQPAYIEELQRIADLQKSITESIRVCSNGRKCLKYIKDGTLNGLTIVNHHKKRESLAKLLDSLLTISDLRKSVIETRSLIGNQDDFPRAIQMCKDGKDSLAPYDKYRCVNDLRSKLNDTLELIGERMDIVLSKMFVSYDPKIYLKLNTAYAMLDRGEIAVGQLLMHFNAYHRSSVEELKMFLENELWEMLPVKSDFTLVQLKEFAFLRQSARTMEDYTKKPIDLVLQASRRSSGSMEDLFGERNDLSNQTSSIKSVTAHTAKPIDVIGTLPPDRISLSSDSDLDSELEREFVDEDEPPSPSSTPIACLRSPRLNSPKAIDTIGPNKSTSRGFRLTHIFGPVLTNSSLNVLRLAGRYIQMMAVLKPITYEILLKVYKLLDVYAIFVFKKFGPDNDKQVIDVITSLRGSLLSSSGMQPDTLESASAALFGPEGDSREQAQELSNVKKSAQVDSKKSVAIESLIFLVNQFWNLQEYLETLISAEQRIQLREQFSQNTQSKIIPDFLKARAEMNQFES